MPQPGLCGLGSLRKCGLTPWDPRAHWAGELLCRSPYVDTCPCLCQRAGRMGQRARAGSAVTRRNVLEFISFLGLSWGGRLETNLLVVACGTRDPPPEAWEPAFQQGTAFSGKSSSQKMYRAAPVGLGVSWSGAGEADGSLSGPSLTDGTRLPRADPSQ